MNDFGISLPNYPLPYPQISDSLSIGLSIDFPSTYIIGTFHGAKAAYCKECHLIFTRPMEAYIHLEAKHLVCADISKKKSK